MSAEAGAAKLGLPLARPPGAIAAASPPVLKQAMLVFGKSLTLSSASSSLSTTSLTCSALHMSSSSSIASGVSSIVSSASALERKTGGQRKEAVDAYVGVKLRCIAGGAAVAADMRVCLVPRVIPTLTQKRARYSDETRATIVEAAKAHGLAEALRRLHNMGGYDNVSGRTIRRWKRALGKEQKKRGRHGTDDAFNRAVLDQLIFTVVENVADAPSLSVKANVCHSYEVIKCAAVKAQAFSEFAGDVHIQSLKFSIKC